MAQSTSDEQSFIRKLPFVRAIYNSFAKFKCKTPRDKWNFFRDIGSMVLKVTGVNILDPNFKVTLHSSLCGLIVLDFTVLMIYSLYYYSDDILVAIQPFAAVGGVYPSFIVYVIVMKESYRNRYQSLLFFPGKYIYPDFNASPGYVEVCDKAVLHLVKTTLEDILLFLFSVWLLAAIPMYLLVFEQQKNLLLPIICPFVDPATDKGFLINSIHTSGLGFVGVLFENFTFPDCSCLRIHAQICGIIGVEFETEICKNATWVQAAVVCYDLDELDKLLETNIKPYDVKMRLRAILAKIRDCDNYISEWTSLFYWKFFLQPVFLIFSVTVALFLFMVADWGMGLTYSMGFYTVLFVVCKLGDEVETANKLVLRKLYSCKWYKMMVNEQLLVGHSIYCHHFSGVIRMGPFDALNYETAAGLTQFCYKMLMMLVRLFGET